MNDIETRLKKLQDEVRDITTLLEGVRRTRPLPRTSEDTASARRDSIVSAITDVVDRRVDDLRATFNERPTEPELAPPTIVDRAVSALEVGDRVHLPRRTLGTIQAFVDLVDAPQRWAEVRWDGETELDLVDPAVLAVPNFQLHSRCILTPVTDVANEAEAATYRRAVSACASVVRAWPVDPYITKDVLREALATAVSELVPIVVPMAASIRARIAAVEAKRRGPPAIAKLAEYAQRFILAYRGADSVNALDAATRNEIGVTIHEAKKEDAELQQLRIVARTTGEYFAAKACVDSSTDAAHGDVAYGEMLDAKKRLFDLLAAWTNPARPT